MKLIVAVLALTAVLGPVVEAQSSKKKCQTIQQIIDKTSSLSLLKAITAQRIPALTKITTDPKLKVTFLAPSNKVLRTLTLKAAQLGLLDPKKALNLLLSHVLKGNYDSEKAWNKVNGQKIQRYALGPVTVTIAIADDFKKGISYFYLTLESVTPGYTPVKLTFASNKKYPGIKTCAGTVYIVDEVFLPSS